MYSVCVVDRGGIRLLNAFTTFDAAEEYLANWCRSQWLEQGEHDDYDMLLDVNNHKAIQEYFDYWDEVKWDIRKATN